MRFIGPHFPENIYDLMEKEKHNRYIIPK